MINKNSFDKNREIFFLIFSAIIAGSIVGGRALSYQGTITHPSLTGNIAKIYNANFDRKLSYDEINWLEQGSVKEDLAPRWLNHYYNSENGTGLGSMMSSRDWAQSPNYQAVAAVFSGGNQTWQKAIESYAKGDMREAFYALGHVLHLLEDATVPAHTRLDAHPEGDVYENYVFNKAGENINFSVAPMAVSSLDSAFFDLATYSSGNFLSKDTIKSADLKNKNVIFKEYNGNVYRCIQGIKEICLVLVKRELAGDVYYLDSPVHSDYFSLLGPTAVSYGAGVIRLFFEEAEKAKKEYEVKSWWQKLKEGTSGLLASVPGSTFYAGIGTGGFASNNASGNEASVFIVSTFVPALTPASSPVGATEIKEEIAVGLSLGFVIKEEKPSVDLIKEIAPPETKAPSAIIEDTILSQSLLPGLGLLSFLPGMGGSMPPPIPSLSLEPDVAPPETTIVSQPSNPAASTTAVFVFVSSEIDSTFFCQLDGATSTICVSPQEYDNLSEGSHILKVRAIDAVGNEDLTPAEYSWNIDLAPETNIGLSNYSLLNINFTVNWNSFSSDVDYYDVQYRIGEQGIWQDWAMATTTISKSFRAAYDNAIYYFRVRAIDSIGQAGAWQEIQAPVSLKPVIINEIMYDPNPGSDSYYEYVELYNRSPIAIDLAGWQFISGSNLHTISADTIHNGSSTIITPRGFALLTDRVSSPVASSTYDGYYLIPDYSDSTLRLRINDASLDLINTGASLLLENASSAIVDEVSYTSSWGAHNDGKSLERINYNNLYSQNKIAWSQSSSGGTPNAANSSLNLAAGSYIAENTIISSDFIWAKAGSPYLLHSANVNADVILIIEPGTTIRPQSKYVDSLTARGTLKINGTVAEPVLFTSKEAVPRAGDWGTAINFTSNSLNSEIFYTTFEYGGYQNPYPSYYVKPAVVVNGSGVNFNDCIFRDIQNRGLDLIASDSIMSNLQFYRFSSNAAVALYISGESLPVIKNSSFQGSGHSGTAIKINDQAEPQIESNNISGFNTAIWLESAYPNISGNALTDNTKNGIYVSDHTVISKNTVWQNGNVYLLMSNSSQYPTVAASTTLTLEPGVIIKPLNKYYTALKIKGSLVADGNSSSTLINFTSFKDDLLGGDSNNDGNLTNATSTVGDWMNIWFADGSRSTLKFVRFQFGGFHRGIGVEWRVKEDSLKIDAGAQMLMEEISVE